MIRHDSDPAFVRQCILALLERTLSNPREDFFLGLKAGCLEVSPQSFNRNNIPTTYLLRFWLPIDNYKAKDEEWFSELIEDAFKRMHEDDEVAVRISFKIVPAIIPASESGLNNASFKTEFTHLHDELRFRSRSEISIHNVLKQRNVLFFPNPAAILGRQSPEEYEKREPDFLVCHRGKWGILEVSGEPWHSGAISTAKDHDRARLFQRYGLNCIQHFDSRRCQHSAADVVDEFLTLLAQS